MWDGYFDLGDVEIINVSRVEAYAENFELRWFKPLFENDVLVSVVGDDPYSDPATDQAPWWDPRIPASAEFYGIYPLEITGMDDSTASSGIEESVLDGGTLTATRRGTKTGVFNVLLIAASEAGAEYGKQWLSKALQGPCGGPVSDCDGQTLAFLASEPLSGDSVLPGECYGRLSPRPSDPLAISTALARSFRRVKVTTPLVVTSKRKMTDGAAVWMATFTLTAANPYEFGVERPFLYRWGDLAAPWPEGTAPDGASVSGPTVVAEESCPQSAYSPLYDPLYPGVVPPPPPPGLTWGGYVPPADWNRRQAILPASWVPGWTEAVPVVQITPAVDAEARNVRIRFYPDPLETGVVADECDFAVDLVVSYVPEGGILTVDPLDRMVYVDTAQGVRQRADNLVYNSEATAFEWPALTCGISYVVTFDVDTTEATPSVDVTLVERLG